MSRTVEASHLTAGVITPPGEHRIATIEAATCRFSLPEPIILEHFEIRFRDYLVVKVTTSSGVEGVAWALTRGAPVAQVLEDVIAPLAIGMDALAVPALLGHIERQLALLGTEGLVQRAYSLLDIALWDIKGQAAGLPVWGLLGGRTVALPALLVDAYPKPGSDEGELVERIAAHAAEGYHAFKLHAAPDPAVTAALLAAIREAVGPTVELVVDVSMGWRHTGEGIAALRQWAPYEPAWVEDPFRGDEFESVRRIRERSSVPIGAGDEVANPQAMRRLITGGAVDVARLDATCQGGISGFAALAALAVSHGCTVSAHTYPEIHQHCALALPGVRHVELFAPGTPYDCTEAFLRPASLVRARDGVVRAPERPGLGVEIDWAAVRKHRLQ